MVQKTKAPPAPPSPPAQPGVHVAGQPDPSRQVTMTYGELMKLLQVAGAQDTAAAIMQRLNAQASETTK